MPRASLIIAIAACLAQGGCVHQEAGGAFAWSFQQNPDEGVKLAYGQPMTDNVLLMMTCEPGSSRVLLSALAAEPRDAIVLGGERFSGEAMPNVMGGGHLVEAEARAGAPALAAFARTGDLALTEGRRKVSLDAAPAEQAGVRRFFETCRA